VGAKLLFGKSVEGVGRFYGVLGRFCYGGSLVWRFCSSAVSGAMVL
jgi:hypothetical protein